MMGPDKEIEDVRTIGVYLPPEIVDSLDDYLYEVAGVKDVRSYFKRERKVPEGDPGAEAMHDILISLTRNFDEWYEKAEWEFAEDVSPNDFEHVRLAASVSVVYDFREKVEAAKVIKGCDSRTVHTALFEAFRGDSAAKMN